MFNRQARIIMEQIEEWAAKDIPQETWKEWVIELLEESLTAAAGHSVYGSRQGDVSGHDGQWLCLDEQ